jgi:hypothetical protein
MSCQYLVVDLKNVGIPTVIIRVLVTHSACCRRWLAADDDAAAPPLYLSTINYMRARARSLGRRSIAGRRIHARYRSHRARAPRSARAVHRAPHACRPPDAGGPGAHVLRDEQRVGERRGYVFSLMRVEWFSTAATGPYH